MCDIWKANENGTEITAEQLFPHLESFKRLHVRRFVLSGGEPLMHSNLFTFCEMLKQRRVKITLLSTGILLARYAAEIVKWCDDVIVSLDGSPAVHDRIRNIPGAFQKLADGVKKLREANPKFKITARCVVQRKNYFDLGRTVDTARDLGLDSISFLAADVISPAFNHSVPWEGRGDVALTPEETKHFSLVIEAVLRTHKSDIASGFIVESSEKIRRLLRHYRALNDDDSFPEPVCNAPWVSSVVESDGTVRPCFFHAPLGNILETPLEEILNSDEAIAFRENLDMSEDPTCRRCVCTLYMKTVGRP
jgi:MoaA/NifB/PqqE/SkfB family radical SAM enzyme